MRNILAQMLNAETIVETKVAGSPLLDWVGRRLIEQDRQLFQTGVLPSTFSYLFAQPLHSYLKDASHLGEQPSLECLAECWRGLVRPKDSFVCAADYYASIRACYQLQGVLAEVLKPLEEMSSVAGKFPEAVLYLEKELNQHRTQAPVNPPPPEPPTAPVSQDSQTDLFKAWRLAMRQGDESQALLRSLLLLSRFNPANGPKPLKHWLEYPHFLLAGETPLALATQGRWPALAELLDKIFTPEGEETTTTEPALKP